MVRALALPPRPRSSAGPAPATPAMPDSAAKATAGDTAPAGDAAPVKDESPAADTDTRTRQELYAEAQRLDIPGRSKMNRDALARAVAEHS